MRTLDGYEIAAGDLAFDKASPDEIYVAISSTEAVNIGGRKRPISELYRRQAAAVAVAAEEAAGDKRVAAAVEKQKAEGHAAIAADVRAAAKALAQASAPYPWCSQPEKCCRIGYCPRSPNCGD